jgi:hypothetical protein
VAVLREVAIPLGDYPTGVHDLGIKIIQDQDIYEIYFELRRCTDADLTIWPNEDTKVSYTQSVSFDNGKTWIEAGGFEAMGGIHVLRDGTQAPISTFTVSVPPQSGGNKRRLHPVIEIINGPLRTEGFTELRS